MGNTGFVDAEQATGLLDTALSAIAQIRDGEFWKLGDGDQFTLGRQLETVARVVYAAQVHLAGEMDTKGLAAQRFCSSTAALLREAFNISAPDARARVKAARQTLPRESLVGAEMPPALPLLAKVLDAGAVGPEHVRTIVDTMAKLPSGLTDEGRVLGEQLLVDNALVCDPTHFQDAARVIAEKMDPDGKLDDTTPASKMEFSIGGRSVATGLTSIKGLLDDYSVEVLRKAIDPLSPRKPEVNGVKDLRSAANRQAHGLVEALQRYLNSGTGPSQAGEVPHITVIMEWDALDQLMKRAAFDSGHSASALHVRRLFCDAKVLPAVLGGDGQVLSVGRSQRTFPVHIRKAITVRDRGCAWPGL